METRLRLFLAMHRSHQAMVRMFAEYSESPHPQPAVLRKKVLSHLCRISGASSAFLILLDQSDEPVAVGTPLIERYRNSVEAFLNSTRKVSLQRDSNERFRKRLFVKLLYSGTPLGVVALLFEKATLDDSIKPLLLMSCGWLSVIEQNLRLTRMLEAGKRNLQNLSTESAAILKSKDGLFQQLLFNQNKLRIISKGIIRMQEEERAKIARELHDGVGQALSALKINLDLVANQLPEGAPGTETLLEATKLAEQTLAEVRELAHLLRPRMLDDLGLYATLRWYLKTFSSRTGIPVDLQLPASEPRLDDELETMIFRVTQEALTNVLKHSRSKTAAVKLAVDKDSVALKIEDSGIGFEPDKLSKTTPAGAGLLGIGDRVAVFGGHVSIQSRPGSGTILSIEVPLKDTIAGGKRGKNFRSDQ